MDSFGRQADINKVLERELVVFMRSSQFDKHYQVSGSFDSSTTKEPYFSENNRVDFMYYGLAIVEARFDIISKKIIIHVNCQQQTNTFNILNQIVTCLHRTVAINYRITIRENSLELALEPEELLEMLLKKRVKSYSALIINKEGMTMVEKNTNGSLTIPHGTMRNPYHHKVGFLFELNTQLGIYARHEHIEEISTTSKEVTYFVPLSKCIDKRKTGTFLPLHKFRGKLVEQNVPLKKLIDIQEGELKKAITKDHQAARIVSSAKIDSSYRVLRGNGQIGDKQCYYLKPSDTFGQVTLTLKADKVGKTAMAESQVRRLLRDTGAILKTTNGGRKIIIDGIPPTELAEHLEKYKPLSHSYDRVDTLKRNNKENLGANLGASLGASPALGCSR